MICLYKTCWQHGSEIPLRETLNREYDRYSQLCHPSRYENFALFEDGNKTARWIVMIS